MIFFLMTWSLASIGFFAWASTMQKHQKQFFIQPLNASQMWLANIVAWGLAILGLVLCIDHYGIADGISYWLGLLSFAALFVVLTVSYFPHKFTVTNIILALIFVLTASLNFW